MAQFLKGPMGDPELYLLTKIANMMPCRKMKMGQVDTVYGPLYMAWGKDAEGKYHGLWGTCGIAMPVEFKKDTRERDVKGVLEMAAATMIKSLEAEGLIS